MRHFRPLPTILSACSAQAGVWNAAISRPRSLRACRHVQAMHWNAAIAGFKDIDSRDLRRCGATLALEGHND